MVSLKCRSLLPIGGVDALRAYYRCSVLYCWTATRLISCRCRTHFENQTGRLTCSQIYHKLDIYPAIPSAAEGSTCCLKLEFGKHMCWQFLRLVQSFARRSALLSIRTRPQDGNWSDLEKKGFSLTKPCNHPWIPRITIYDAMIEYRPSLTNFPLKLKDNIVCRWQLLCCVLK